MPLLEPLPASLQRPELDQAVIRLATDLNAAGQFGQAAKYLADLVQHQGDEIGLVPALDVLDPASRSKPRAQLRASPTRLD